MCNSHIDNDLVVLLHAHPLTRFTAQDYLSLTQYWPTYLPCSSSLSFFFFYLSSPIQRVSKLRRISNGSTFFFPSFFFFFFSERLYAANSAWSSSLSTGKGKKKIENNWIKRWQCISRFTWKEGRFRIFFFYSTTFFFFLYFTLPVCVVVVVVAINKRYCAIFFFPFLPLFFYLTSVLRLF